MNTEIIGLTLTELAFTGGEGQSFDVDFLTGFRLPARFTNTSHIERHSFLEQPIKFSVPIYIHGEYFA
jgi:hypothetical protein